MRSPTTPTTPTLRPPSSTSRPGSCPATCECCWCPAWPSSFSPGHPPSQLAVRPDRLGRGTPAWWNTIVGRVGEESEERDVGPAPRWVADNERTVLAFAVAFGVLTLLVWTRPTGLVVLMVIVAVALVMAGTSLLGEIGRRADDLGGHFCAGHREPPKSTLPTPIPPRTPPQTTPTPPTTRNSTDNADSQSSIRQIDEDREGRPRFGRRERSIDCGRMMAAPLQAADAATRRSGRLTLTGERTRAQRPSSPCAA